MLAIPLPARRGGFDIAVAAACVAVEAVFIVVGTLSREVTAPEATVRALGWTILLAADASLVARRRAPLAVLGVTVLASVPWFDLFGGVDQTEPWLPVAAPIAAYSAVVHGRDRVVTWVLVTGLAVAIAGPWRLSLETVSTGFLLAVLPALLGLYIAERRRLVAALTDRADRAEREQLLLAEQARAAERLRLASEMHDVVSHRVSLMVLQAGALRVSSTDETVRATAEQLRAAGSQALDELRELVGVLRTAPETESQAAEAADLPDLTRLVAESRSVGVAVTLLGDGLSARVPAAVGRTVYRVVQEALTNVRKHAPGAATTVRVESRPERLTVSIHNGESSDAPDAALSGTGSRTGLAGLRQRVELLGGTLTAGPEEPEGFTVTATLPRHVPTDPGGRR